MRLQVQPGLDDQWRRILVLDGGKARHASHNLCDGAGRDVGRAGIDAHPLHAASSWRPVAVTPFRTVVRSARRPTE